MVKNWLKLGALPLALFLSACGALLEGGSSRLEVRLAFPQEVAPGQEARGTLTVSSSGVQGQAFLGIASPSGITLVSPRVINITEGTNEYPVTVRVSEDLRPGTYTVRMIITAQDGSSAEARANLKVVEAPQDFSIALTPQSLTLTPGSSGSLQLTLTPQGGFTGTVNLGLVGAPSGVELNPTSLTVSTGPVSQTLTLSVGTGVAPGNYALKLRASSGSLAKEVDLALTVSAPPSFELTATPTSLSTRVGETALLTVTLTPREGFQGAVLVSLSAPDFAEASPTQTAVNLVSGQASASFQVRGTGEGSGTLTVRAESGTIVRTLSVPLRVQPYAIEASATPATGYVPHTRPTTTLTLTGRGYSGLVLVEASGGYAVSPNVVEAQDGAARNHTLTLIPPSGAPFGLQEVTLTLTTTSTGPRATVRVPVTLQGIRVNVNGTTTPSPNFFLVNFTVQRLGGYTGNLSTGSFSLVRVAGPPCSPLYTAPTPLASPPDTYEIGVDMRSCPSGTYTFRLEADNGQVAASATFDLTVVPQGLSASVNPPSLTVYRGSAANFTLELTPSGGLSGLVALSLENGSGPVSWASLVPSYVTIAPSGRQSFSITVNAASGAPTGTHGLTLKLVHSAGQTTVPISLEVREPTFHIALSRSSFTLRPGEGGTTALSLTTEGGFSGTVSLFLDGPEASNFALTPSTVDTSAPTWGLLITNVSASTPGTYNLTLRATSGSVTRTVPITVTVPPSPDFVIAVDPTSLIVPAGGSGTLTLIVTPLYGFTGSINLILTDPAGNPVAPNFLVSPTTVTVTGSAPQNFTLTLDVASGVAPGNYFLVLRNTSGTRTALFQVNVR
jgi:hypothetical protein